MRWYIEKPQLLTFLLPTHYCHSTVDTPFLKTSTLVFEFTIFQVTLKGMDCTAWTLMTFQEQLKTLHGFMRTWCVKMASSLRPLPARTMKTETVFCMEVFLKVRMTFCETTGRPNVLSWLDSFRFVAILICLHVKIALFPTQALSVHVMVF